MDLPLQDSLEYGFITGFGSAKSGRKLVAFAEAEGFDSFWVGDHIAFPVPINDALAQLACVAGMSDRLTIGTGVYLLPLRHPTPVAKQVATVQALCGNRMIFGVGVGGEFPNEYAACGVPVQERGARLSEGIEVLKKLWSGEKVSNDGPFYPFPPVRLRPTPGNGKGPPIWCGGRSAPALRRCGELADGWMSYVVSPDQYGAGLETISRAASGRDLDHFGSGHLLFARIDDSYESALDVASAALSERYGMDFRSAAKRYCALGRPEDFGAVVAFLCSESARFITGAAIPVDGGSYEGLL